MGTASPSVHRLSPGAAAADVLAHAVAGDLFPLDLLPCDGQLSPQALERALAEAREAPVQLFLVLPLAGADFLDDAGARARRYRGADRLVRQQPYVPVLVVVHVHLDAALQVARGWVEQVQRSPTAVPKSLLCQRPFVLAFFIFIPPRPLLSTHQ